MCEGPGSRNRAETPGSKKSSRQDLKGLCRGPRAHARQVLRGRAPPGASPSASHAQRGVWGGGRTSQMHPCFLGGAGLLL
eukprot:199507-Pyramimonas_sp.AAC.1